ncbi:unnamed protein product, partial [Onchocerca ochengi]
MDVEMAMDIIRREAEISDELQGFQLIYSLGGSTGSRFGSSLITKMREEYPNRILSSFSMFPTTKISYAFVAEPYNALLSAQHLIENVDETFCIENEALRNISLHTLKITRPTYYDFNHI